MINTVKLIKIIFNDEYSENVENLGIFDNSVYVNAFKDIMKYYYPDNVFDDTILAKMFGENLFSFIDDLYNALNAQEKSDIVSNAYYHYFTDDNIKHLFNRKTLGIIANIETKLSTYIGAEFKLEVEEINHY